MAVPLSPEQFSAFFQEVHHHTPFPWQRGLMERVARSSDGEWPALLDLPTGAGKTAALDIAVFHLALEANRGPHRRAPVRIVLAVDRRLIVDDAFARAQEIAAALKNPQGTVTHLVAERLKILAGDGDPLLARRLRGGVPLEDDWARTPVQPTILCSTVDQVGSRLLFRGYGVSNRAKPMQAGLLGADCRILLDEAHLAEPFRQTLAWIRRYKDRDWSEVGASAPWGVSLLTATPGGRSPDERVSLSAEDYLDPVLARRWLAAKPAKLITVADARDVEGDKEDTASPAADLERTRRMATEARAAISALQESGIASPAIGIVVNRVRRARELFSALHDELGDDVADILLMIGPARPVERDVLAKRLQPIRTGEGRDLDRPFVLVATQCIEAGVDIDLDGLITEAAPVDALRQRFGRLNRDGREIRPYAAVVVARSETSSRAIDPIYGKAIPATWTYLCNAASSPKRGQPLVLDFGLSAFDALARRNAFPDEALSPKVDGPVLLPAHLDLLSETSPIPAVDPEISLYLHGPDRQPASVTAVWRADVTAEFAPDALRRILLLVPPRSAEAIELPLWAVRRWLSGEPDLDLLADIADVGPQESARSRRSGARRSFRWAGDDDSSDWISPAAIRPGDTLVLPASYGGVDVFGWNPDSVAPVEDVAVRAATPFHGRRFALRLAPGLGPAGEAGQAYEAALADVLGAMGARDWRSLRDALLDLPLPVSTREALVNLDRANSRRHGRKVITYTNLYGMDAGRPRGVVFVAPFGLEDADTTGEGLPGATEDDSVGSLPGVAVSLEQHSRQVAEKAEAFALLAGLTQAMTKDLWLAGLLHDAGKADPRFQAVLAFGDPLGQDPDLVLAKSARPVPGGSGHRSELPPHWRHEALSVRIAARNPRLASAADPELVLWLIGTHHGLGRPFFPHADERDACEQSGLPHAGPGPQSLAYSFRGFSWPDLYDRLKARYGLWDLARMEVILRLADHRVSERERESGKGGAA